MEYESIVIEESGMAFGPFEKAAFFPIEKSKVLRTLGEGYKSVEFVCLRAGHVDFIEAKSSSPRPTSDNCERFDGFIDEIAAKLSDAFQVFASSLLGRNDASEIGSKILGCDFSAVKLRYCVVINGHQLGWLLPIQDALNRRLAKIGKIWKITVVVMNDVIAREENLID